MGEKAGDGRRGWLIVFEGIDGSGKTTQMRRVAEALRARGLGVVELFEPTRGRFGQQIRSLAQQKHHPISPEQEMELFIRDRMEDVEKNIRPALERGNIVLLDRYYYSTIAYQGARGLDPPMIQQRNEAFAPRPDLVLYFSLSVDEAMRRIKGDVAVTADLFEQAGESEPTLRAGKISRSGKRFEKRDYLKRVKKIYDELAQRENIIQPLDADADEETVARQVLAAIDRCLAARS